MKIKFQKQPSRDILRKRCPENMKKITGENPCRSALQLYLNQTSAWVLSCILTAYFQNTFSQEHFWMAASVCCWNWIRCNGWGASSNCWAIEQSSVKNSRFHKAFLKKRACKVVADFNLWRESLLNWIFYPVASRYTWVYNFKKIGHHCRCFPVSFGKCFKTIFFNPLMPGNFLRI